MIHVNSVTVYLRAKHNTAKVNYNTQRDYTDNSKQTTEQYSCSKINTSKMTLMDYPLFFTVSRPLLYMFRASGSSLSGVHLFVHCTVSLWHTVYCNI